MNQLVRLAIGLVAGGAVGWAIYRFVGCQSGACPITSNPYVSITVYALAGLLLAWR